MSKTTKYQLLSVLASLGLLGAPCFVPLLLFPRVFHDRALRLLLVDACIAMIMFPIWFKVSRHLMKWYTEPPGE